MQLAVGGVLGEIAHFTWISLEVEELFADVLEDLRRRLATAPLVT